jgi:zinc/manganese transport system ATP-binding protein
VTTETARTTETKETATATAPAAQAVPATHPVLQMRDACLSYGQRVIWRGLTFDISAGEFVAVLGPNGSGKSSLIKVLLGRQALSSGGVWVAGRRPRGGNRRVGLIPQHASPAAGDIRARDLVRLGIDGHRWGAGGGRAVRARTDELLAAVGATAYAQVPVRMLSGGERQRLRIAQALAGDPAVLLCDEPLASLDLAHQQGVTALVDAQRRARRSAVVFVTHDINPVLPYVDRVLYLARGAYRLGTPAQVLTSECLSDLYGAPVEVVRTGRGVAVLGANGADGEHCC